MRPAVFLIYSQEKKKRWVAAASDREFNRLCGDLEKTRVSRHRLIEDMHIWRYGPPEDQRIWHAHLYNCAEDQYENKMIDNISGSDRADVMRHARSRKECGYINLYWTTEMGGVPVYFGCYEFQAQGYWASHLTG